MPAVIAFATCAALGAKPDTDSQVLIPHLRELGVDAVFVPWGDPIPSSAKACIVKATWDYYQRPGEYLAWADKLAKAMPVWNEPALLRWNAHKSYLLTLAEGGVPIVPTQVYNAFPAEDAFWRDLPWPDLVIKPAVSVGALNTRRFSNLDPEAWRFARNLLTSSDVVIQPFVPSILTEGEISLVYVEGSFSHAVRKTVPAGGFAAQRDQGATITVCTPQPGELQVAQAALARVSTPLLARVDLVQTDGSPVVMELELIEPALFLDLEPRAAIGLARAIAARLDALTEHTDT